MDIQETIKVFLRQRPVLENEIPNSGTGGIGKIVHSANGTCDLVIIWSFGETINFSH